MQTNSMEKYMRAKKRVGRIKRFYCHLTLYVVANIILLILKAYFLGFFESNGTNDPNIYYWLEWNIISTPILWGIGLIIHGLFVFKLPFVAKWEKRQIQKFMNEDGPV